jgi:hypothetical protein
MRNPLHLVERAADARPGLALVAAVAVLLLVAALVGWASAPSWP